MSDIERFLEAWATCADRAHGEAAASSAFHDGMQAGLTRYGYPALAGDALALYGAAWADGFDAACDVLRAVLSDPVAAGRERDAIALVLAERLAYRDAIDRLRAEASEPTEENVVSIRTRRTTALSERGRKC